MKHIEKVEQTIGFVVIEILMFIGAIITHHVDPDSLIFKSLFGKWVIFSVVFWIMLIVIEMMRGKE